MIYKNLGNSNIQISRIGFGCMSLNIEAPNSCEQIIHHAINNGINFFDTADLYDFGENEMLLGKILRGSRNRVFIATKVGNQWRNDKSGWDWNPGKRYILEAVEKSLSRLQTDYIDLYQLHGGTIEDPIDEAIEAFEILKQQGKIRHYGISSIRPNVIKEYVKRSRIESVMMQYSLLDRRPEAECLPLLEKNNIGVLARGSLAKGLLAGKPADKYLDHNKEYVQRVVDKINKHSSHERTPCHVAIQWCLYHTAVTTAVVGIRTMKQLIEAIEAVSAPMLTKEEYNSMV